MRTIMPAKILVSCKLFSREEKMSVKLLLLVSPMSYFTRISVLGHDQFTAVGPPLTGSGFPRSGFSTRATGMAYGLNVQGDRCGVYGESVMGGGDRESTNERVGVPASAENFGHVGNVNREIAWLN